MIPPKQISNANHRRESLEIYCKRLQKESESDGCPFIFGNKVSPFLVVFPRESYSLFL